MSAINEYSAIKLLERALEAKDKHIQHLLETNNAYLERARKAEARVKSLEGRIERVVMLVKKGEGYNVQRQKGHDRDH